MNQSLTLSSDLRRTVHETHERKPGAKVHDKRASDAEPTRQQTHIVRAGKPESKAVGTPLRPREGASDG